jgi:flavin reductase (DIM6/NTAB) family NADH-FMN oxidoreductase RutF
MCVPRWQAYSERPWAWRTRPWPWPEGKPKKAAERRVGGRNDRGRADLKKVAFPIDKREWHPSLIPGPIVLVSSYNAKKEPNIAPKSWLQMVSFEPPMVMFSGTKGRTTEQNVLASGCFGVNFVDAAMAQKVFTCLKWRGLERIEKLGFRMVPASQIQAPLVEDSKAHLECRLHESKEIGSGLVIFGEIVAASIWEEILRVEPLKRYQLLDQILYLEEGVFSRVLDIVRVVENDARPR